jgi:hypothetical protein
LAAGQDLQEIEPQFGKQSQPSAVLPWHDQEWLGQ